MSTAIDSLDPSKESIKETYKRIMARNRQGEEQMADMGADDSGNNTGNVSPRAQYNRIDADHNNLGNQLLDDNNPR